MTTPIPLLGSRPPRKSSARRLSRWWTGERFSNGVRTLVVSIIRFTGRPREAGPPSCPVARASRPVDHPGPGGPLLYTQLKGWSHLPERVESDALHPACF
eukprot:9034759-Pyramimonas_sp.AAC.1